MTSNKKRTRNFLPLARYPRIGSSKNQLLQPGFLNHGNLITTLMLLRRGASNRSTNQPVPWRQPAFPKNIGHLLNNDARKHFFLARDQNHKYSRRKVLLVVLEGFLGAYSLTVGFCSFKGMLRSEGSLSMEWSSSRVFYQDRAYRNKSPIRGDRKVQVLKGLMLYGFGL
jgi:hypothetical protein